MGEMRNAYRILIRYFIFHVLDDFNIVNGCIGANIIVGRRTIF
jgi:hypothetical protein